MISRSRRRKPAPAPWAAALVVLALIVTAWINQASGIHAVHKAGLPRTKTPEFYSVEPVSVPTPPLPFKIGESSGVLWNLNTHQLLWQLNPHTPGPLASTTKLMTIYLALRELPLTKTVTVTPNAAATTGSDIYMAPGEHYRVKQLLYGLMLASANDAAVELAETMGGSTARFVAEMNEQAARLGMHGTHYADPDGLSPQSVGTAWDLSIIAEQDLQNPLFRRIVDTKETSLPHNPVVRNLNGLLFMDPQVIGVKTGWTTAAGFNLIFAATRKVNGHSVTLLGVILHAQDGFPPEDADALKILNWGFHQVKLQTAPPRHPV